jgi:flavin-dependent dehydrogenase
MCRKLQGHGLHLDRVAFDTSLLGVAERAGARVERAARLRGRPALREGTWQLEAELGPCTRALTARFVVDATGGSADTPAGRMARAAEGFTRLLEGTLHIREAVGSARPLDAPAAVGANSSSLDPLCGPGRLAVGDAALTFDPLSSQGISTALFTTEKAAATVYHALGGAEDALSRYATLLRRLFTAYRLSHVVAYASEQRWPDQVFRKRRGVAAPSRRPFA